MPPIRIEGLTKAYKDGPLAVDHVDLEIGDGEFMVLVGPSGCGKSTMLQMLAGIVEVTDGRIFIGDQDVTRLDPRKRDIAMVFQSYALYPHLSVRGNLGFGLKLRKTDKRRSPSGSTRSRGSSASTSCWTASRASSRAGSASASRWAARSCASRARS